MSIIYLIFSLAKQVAAVLVLKFSLSSSKISAITCPKLKLSKLFSYVLLLLGMTLAMNNQLSIRNSTLTACSFSFVVNTALKYFIYLSKNQTYTLSQVPRWDAPRWFRWLINLLKFTPRSQIMPPRPKNK